MKLVEGTGIANGPGDEGQGGGEAHQGDGEEQALEFSAPQKNDAQDEERSCQKERRLWTEESAEADDKTGKGSGQPIVSSGHGPLPQRRKAGSAGDDRDEKQTGERGEKNGPDFGQGNGGVVGGEGTKRGQPEAGEKRAASAGFFVAQKNEESGERADQHAGG